MKHFKRSVLVAVAAVCAALTFGAASSSAALPVVYNVASAAPNLFTPNKAPAGANDWNCKPSAAHPEPVVLVHGTTANMAINWTTLSPLLKNNGYCVFTLNYGEVAASMGFSFGLGPVAGSAQELSDFVDQVRSATGASKVAIVGHSQGGMMPNYYIKFLGGASKVAKMIGLAPDNHGTDVGGMLRLANQAAAIFPGLANVIYGAIGSNAQGLLDQKFDSPFIQHLNSVPDTVPGVKYTVIATKFDEVVTPYQSQFLSGPGVKNITVQSKCWLDFSDHISIAFDHVALREVLNALDPAHARNTICTPVLPLIGG